jgi:hypothetical protein
MALQLPNKLHCRATLYGQAVQGVLLISTFSTVAKNPYHFVFGPTDASGMAHIDKFTILRQAEAELNLAMMDFQPLEAVFSGQITTRAMGADDIGRALEAHALFADVFCYPDQYEAMLKTALTNYATAKAQDISVTQPP